MRSPLHAVIFLRMLNILYQDREKLNLPLCRSWRQAIFNDESLLSTTPFPHNCFDNDTQRRKLRLLTSVPTFVSEVFFRVDRSFKYMWHAECSICFGQVVVMQTLSLAGSGKVLLVSIHLAGSLKKCSQFCAEDHPLLSSILGIHACPWLLIKSVELKAATETRIHHTL